MTDQIFISYRRDDAAYVTGHINDLLRKEFGDASVFTDVDNIALGVDFRAVLDETVSQCRVFLAVIGSEWLTARNYEGELRLDDPADFVRIEVESALKRNIPVIPLLVSGAKMPAAEDLPESIRGLAFRNGTQIRPAPDFSADMARLIKNLRRHFESIHDEELGIDVKSGSAATVVEATQSAEPLEKNMTGVGIRVEDDDRARKNAQLGADQRSISKRSGVRFWLVAAAIVAAAFWFVANQYPETMDAGLGVFQTDSTNSVQSPNANESGGDLKSLGESTRVEVDPVPENDSVLVQELVPARPVDEPIVAESIDQPISDPAAEDLSATNSEPTSESADLPTANDDFEVTETPESVRQADSARSVSEGVRLAGVGDHITAIEIFDAAIMRDDKSAFAYKQRATSYLALGEYEAAINDYDVALELNAEDVNAYYRRAASHFALGNFASAIADYDAVIQRDPEFVEAYSRRAAVHEANGDSAAAARDRSVVAVFESKQNR